MLKITLKDNGYTIEIVCKRMEKHSLKIGKVKASLAKRKNSKKRTGRGRKAPR